MSSCSDSKSPLTRRQVVGRAAAVAIPAIIPSGVLARPGRPGANDRIVVANIGIGGMGRDHVGPDTAALCDVDEGRMADVLNTVMKSGKRTMPNPPDLYTDFRRILDRKDIDAVTSGTPDHWHAHITVLACQAGKHVYSEKPTARTIEEGRAMVNAARHYKRVVQIGAQGRSNVNARAACQYVRNGMLGRVSRVEILHPDNPTTERWLDPQPVPKGLDWNMWLGPVRWRPFNSLYHPANFRWFLELGGGQIRDRGNHAISIACWLMKSRRIPGQGRRRGEGNAADRRGLRYASGIWSSPGSSTTGRWSGSSWLIYRSRTPPGAPRILATRIR